jgi:hypothetical protein
MTHTPYGGASRSQRAYTSLPCSRLTSRWPLSASSESIRSVSSTAIPRNRAPEDRCEIAPQQVARHHEREQRLGHDAKAGRQRLPCRPYPQQQESFRLAQGSAHHSLRRLVACYSELRMESPEHSPWRALRDDLNDSSYQGTVSEFSIFQPYEVALVG